MVESMFAVCSYSRITRDILFLDMDCSVFRLEVVARLDSSLAVMSPSTSSGLAPGSTVMMITYGKLMFGRRSAVILVYAT